MQAALAARPSFADMRPGPMGIAQIRIEVLAGLTVALALVPEAVAFAFVAGVHPLVGLYAAFIVGLITAVFGGRPGMISGATGALAVVMVALVAEHGVEYLFATVVLMGLIQVAAGVFRLGKFIRLVPHPVMLGFVNGLAIVIFLAQLGQFQVPGSAEGARARAGAGRMAERLAPDPDAAPCRGDDGDHLGDAETDQRHSGAAGGDRDRRGRGHRVWHRRAAGGRPRLDRGGDCRCCTSPRFR